jgi:hypothetical protein
MERQTRNFLLFAAAIGLAASAIAPGSVGCNPLTGQCPSGLKSDAAPTDDMSRPSRAAAKSYPARTLVDQRPAAEALPK